MPDLKIRNLTKLYHSVRAVDHLNLEVKDGEMLTLLGPSGCGKTTTLRLIAGLERPDEGELLLGDEVLSSSTSWQFRPPEKRGMGMVFQSYAVWPHLTVGENVAFPLRVRKAPRGEIRQRVKNVLSLVGLGGLEERPATLLSGGQQQRVAMARALVFDPKILLLDEPLSNLDSKLRESMRAELKALQQRTGVTAIYVTHDQTEAMALSDRICLMNAGRIEQIGSPTEIYHHPKTKFVVDFIGRTNFIRGRIEEITPDGCVVSATRAQGVRVACRAPEGPAVKGDEVWLSMRPEDVTLREEPPEQGMNVWAANVSTAHFLGDHWEYTLVVGEETLWTRSGLGRPLSPGAAVYLELDGANVRAWTER